MGRESDRPANDYHRRSRARWGQRLLVAAATIAVIAAGWVWAGAPGMSQSIIPGVGVPAAQAGGPAPRGCEPSYSPCVPVDDRVTCDNLGYPVALLGRADPYGLDTDKDGMGCEADQPT